MAEQTNEWSTRFWQRPQQWNIVEASTMGHVCLCLASTERWNLFSSKLFAPVNTACFPLTRSSANISELSTSMEISIMEVLHWSLKRSLDLSSLLQYSERSQVTLSSYLSVESFSTVALTTSRTVKIRAGYPKRKYCTVFFFLFVLV